MTAVQNVFPKAVLQWEDFHRSTAFDNLQRYRNRLPSFNDDISGTAAVGLGGILAAIKNLKTGLADQRIVFLGTGTAGFGIGELYKLALERAELSEEVIARSMVFLDSKGLVYEGRRGVDSDPQKRQVAMRKREMEHYDSTGEADGVGGHDRRRRCL